MKPDRKLPTRGQALIMVTVALVAMSGLIGMAVDFGWSYYMRRSAQAAADSAALAAANSAMDWLSASTPGVPHVLACDNAGISCTTTNCSDGGTANFQSACQYAAKNGFSYNGDNNRQTVRVSGGTDSPHPAGVNAHYWVTVQVTETLPQLYSAILGNANATIAARATAAIVDAAINGSLVGLDRENDPGAPNGPVNLQLGTQARLSASNGILLSSNDPGAGTNFSSRSPLSPFTKTRGNLAGSGPWTSAGPTPNQSDGPQFSDPMRGLGQPPLTSSPLPPRPIPNGTDWSVCAGGICPPGVYFATTTGGTCPSVCASGAALQVPSDKSYTFTADGTASGGTAFGNYVFFGGLNAVSAMPLTFGPGRYVMAGVTGSNYDLNISNTVVNGGSTLGADAGRLFILTDSNYPQISTQVAVVNGYSATPLPGLQFGQTNLNPNGLGFNLAGLSAAQAPTGDMNFSNTNFQGTRLSDFGSIVLWQDQAFSDIKYSPTGNLDFSCGGSVNNACTQTPPNTPQIQLGNSEGMKLYGIMYQPRGAYLRLRGGTISSPGATLIAQQIITGAVDMGDYTAMLLLPLPKSPTMRKVALVE